MPLRTRTPGVPWQYMFVKICGITNEDDALLAVALGADAVGFVFAPSTRQVTPTVARDIARRLPPEVLTVGVFRDELPERVVDVVTNAGLRAAQLHGHEAPEQTRYVRARVPFVIQAFAAGDPALQRAGDHRADAVLVDAPSPGSGRLFDWSLLEHVPLGLRILLAGGLTPDNVATAIDQVRPWGVDVSTGVEASPGRKDARKVKAFIDAARAAAPAPYLGPDDTPYDWQEDE